MRKILFLGLVALGAAVVMAAPSLLSAQMPTLQTPPSELSGGGLTGSSLAQSSTRVPTPPAPTPDVETQAPTPDVQTQAPTPSQPLPPAPPAPTPSCPPECIETAVETSPCPPACVEEECFTFCPITEAPVLSLVPGGVGMIQACWTSVPSAFTYELYTGTSPHFELATPIQTTTDTCFLDAGLVPGATYHYRVVGVNWMMEPGPMSEEAAQTAGIELSTFAPVPELSTVGLVIGGLGALALFARRK